MQQSDKLACTRTGVVRDGECSRRWAKNTCFVSTIVSGTHRMRAQEFVPRASQTSVRVWHGSFTSFPCLPVENSATPREHDASPTSSRRLSIRVTPSSRSGAPTQRWGCACGHCRRVSWSVTRVQPSSTVCPPSSSTRTCAPAYAAA